MNNKYRSLIFACFCLFAQTASAFDVFVIKDIKITGLQRITLGTAFNYLPIKVGDTFTAEQATNSLKALFKTGFFDNVWFTQEGDVLVINVVERPSIASIKIFGNKEITTEDLTKALKDVGLAEGRVFNRSLLDQVEQELNRQYFNQGRYDVVINATITQLERNRVDVEIDIKEGEPARIKHINIIGENKFNEQTLLDKFDLSMPGGLSFFSSNKYSKQQLLGDLESLRSYYLNRGYINFKIESTQVSISPDKRDVFIDINVTEGEQYTVKDIKIMGELILEEEELRKQITVKPGDIFSRQNVIESTNQINDRLGIDGYAFAKVNAVPDVDNDNRTVSLTFYVDPGKRVYVRRINVTGNTKTRDEVIRRELRQQEGGWISTPLINRSKTRLQRLGFFEDIRVKTTPVPGTTDQVDIDFDVDEGSTGNFTAGIGYGQEGGFLFNTSVTLNNYLGTGKEVKVEVNNSQIDEIYNFSYKNPYYTDDGISRAFNIYYRSTNADKANIGSFNSNSHGATVDYGFPFSEFVTGRAGLGYKNTKLVLASNTPEYYKNWVKTNGEDFATYSLTGSVAYDSRNRVLFPTDGFLTSIGAEVALPKGDLEYYQLTYRVRWYVPFTDNTSFVVGGEYGYGDAYGDTKVLPFFENYYAGGTRSVRGFEGNTIGPKGIVRQQVYNADGTPQDGVFVESQDSVGGNRKVLGKMELYFPNPFTDEQSKNFKLSTFLDAGRIFGKYDASDEVVPDERVRASYGVAAVWITPVGALMFNWSWPYKSYDGDQFQRFQFNIGAPF